MPVYNIADAKANLSSLVNRALQGEEVIIARNTKQLLKLVPIEQAPKKRELGSGKCQVLNVSDDFYAPLGDLKAAVAQLAKLEAAGLVRIGKGFPPGFWDNYDGPSDSEGAARAALTEEREER
jgi:prevent-host-death family protein